MTCHVGEMSLVFFRTTTKLQKQNFVQVRKKTSDILRLTFRHALANFLVDENDIKKGHRF
jgi:hypothetical protein